RDATPSPLYRLLRNFIPGPISRNSDPPAQVYWASAHLIPGENSMQVTLTRRDALALAAIGGGIVFASRLMPLARATDDFFFVQLSDAHWGFEDPNANPDPRSSLDKAVAAIKSLSQAPDFVVFTGDLTHKTDDGAVRRKRMAEFKEIIQPLAGLRTI